MIVPVVLFIDAQDLWKLWVWVAALSHDPPRSVPVPATAHHSPARPYEKQDQADDGQNYTDDEQDMKCRNYESDDE
jgi:hypothetical protein